MAAKPQACFLVAIWLWLRHRHRVRALAVPSAVFLLSLAIHGWEWPLRWAGGPSVFGLVDSPANITAWRSIGLWMTPVALVLALWALRLRRTRRNLGALVAANALVTPIMGSYSLVHVLTFSLLPLGPSWALAGWLASFTVFLRGWFGQEAVRLDFLIAAVLTIGYLLYADRGLPGVAAEDRTVTRTDWRLAELALQWPVLAVAVGLFVLSNLALPSAKAVRGAPTPQASPPGPASVGTHPRLRAYSSPRTLALAPGSRVAAIVAAVSWLVATEPGSLAASIALWSHNTNEFSDDATLVVSNNGTGYRLKGFGRDGGEHEFRIDDLDRVWAKEDLAQSRAADDLVRGSLCARCQFYGILAKHSCQVERSFENGECTVNAVPGTQMGYFTINRDFDVSDRCRVAVGAGLSSPVPLDKKASTYPLGSITSQLGRPDPSPPACGQPSSRFWRTAASAVE